MKDNKKNYLKIFSISCAIILLLTICVSPCFGLILLLAFKSNSYFPLATDTIEFAEQCLTDPYNYVREYQIEFSQNLIDILEGISEEGNISFEDFYNKIYLESGFADGELPGKQEIQIMTDIKSKEDDYQVFYLNLEGSSISNKENNRASGNISIELHYSGFDTKGNVDFVANTIEGNPEFYFKINNLPFLKEIENSLNKDIKNKWIYFSQDDLKELTDTYPSNKITQQVFEEISLSPEFHDKDSTSINNEEITISKDLISKLENTLKSEDLLGKVKWEPSKMFGDKRSRCFSISYDNDDIKRIVRLLNDNFGDEEIKDEDLENELKGFNSVEIYLCSDRKENHLNEIKITLNVENEYETPYTGKANILETEIIFDLRLYEYGKNFDVTVPDKGETINFKDIFEEMFNNQIDQDNTTNKIYSLFISSNCDSCSELKEYIKTNNIENKIDIIIYNVDKSNMKDYMKYLCDEFNYCELPLLEILQYPQEEYILGSKNIIKYFEENILN